MNNKKQQSGFTLIEIAISVLIIMVLATGAMGYQYYSARDVRFSEVQTTAARIAMLLLEGWKGDQGASDFDPISVFNSEITINTAATGPSVPKDGAGTNMTLLGYYKIDVEDVYYYVTLSWSAASSQEPRVLNATIAWRSDYAQGTLQGDEAFVQYSTFCVDD